jgi:hypothetical protein
VETGKYRTSKLCENPAAGLIIDLTKRLRIFDERLRSNSVIACIKKYPEPLKTP